MLSRKVYRLALCLGAALLLAPVAGADLMAGVQPVDITPPIGGPMGGYSARGSNVSQGVHDPLYAKALVLKEGDESLAIVTMDLVGFPGDSVATVKKGIREKTGIEHVMLLVSHTHSGPTGSRSFPSKDAPWIAEAERKVVDAVAGANAALVPVKYGVAQGEVDEGHNRRNVRPDGTTTMRWANRERVPTSPVDHAVGVIRLEKLDGGPLVTLVNFTCHPVVLGPENLLISADYPGVMTKTVEGAVGGVCMFAQGACGDINPYWDKTPPSEGAYEQMERMGKTLAAEVVRVSKTITAHALDAGGLTVATEIMPIDLRWDIHDPDVIGTLEQRYGKALVHAYLSRFETPMDAELVTVTLGDDLAFVGWPGEFFVRHGLDLKARCVIPNTFVFGYCNKTFGYFPTINAAWQGGYGAKEATLVEVGAGEKIVARSLVNLYYQTNRLHRIPQF